ncbi:protein-S-isoprenylcysteine methyltransferase [Stenotrophomonas maltophilia]|nr:isoprenylcysteine carboxylmethyltransferase family protein [Stenotrophomonas pavanii]KOQ79656.1 protein-S-isoprenylcysteine methyltransferase [Stenotrophomonas maltophilia]
MTWLENRIPPPVVMLLWAAVGYAACGPWPGFDFRAPVPVLLAGLTMTLGVMLNLLPKVSFRRAGTTVNPLRPSASSVLVTSGIYRRTRNPMYLGQALVLLGAMMYLQNLIALLVVPLFLAYITRLQILPEERALMARFPEAYVQYCRRVPRWL